MERLPHIQLLLLFLKQMVEKSLNNNLIRIASSVIENKQLCNCRKKVSQGFNFIRQKRIAFTKNELFEEKRCDTFICLTCFQSPAGYTDKPKDQ